MYYVIVNGEKIGKVTFNRKDKNVDIDYDFNEKTFSGLFGTILLNDILDFALDVFDNTQKSIIRFNNYKDADYYEDTFNIKKEEEQNAICYYKSR